MDSHTVFIISVVIIIVIFTFLVLATMTLSSEKFKNLSPMPISEFMNDKMNLNPFGHVVDTYVPQDIKFKNATPFYDGLDDGLMGTSLENVSEVLSKRYPIAIETSTNWYNTQPLVGEGTLGTDSGALPHSKCGCNEKNII